MVLQKKRKMYIVAHINVLILLIYCNINQNQRFADLFLSTYKKKPLRLSHIEQRRNRRLNACNSSGTQSNECQKNDGTINTPAQILEGRLNESLF